MRRYKPYSVLLLTAFWVTKSFLLLVATSTLVYIVALTLGCSVLVDFMLLLLKQAFSRVAVLVVCFWFLVIIIETLR
jgi:hypothetical protein